MISFKRIVVKGLRSASSISSPSHRKFCPVDKTVIIPDTISIYTDGSCINNGKDNAISSIGIYFPDQDNLYTKYSFVFLLLIVFTSCAFRNVGEVLKSSILHTNQRAELMVCHILYKYLYFLYRLYL